MSLERRVAKLEDSLTPKQAVLAWLAEAHAFRTLPEYVATLRAGPDEAWPLVRIAEQVEASARAKTRGRPEDAWAAVRRAVGDACFLVELVVKMNLEAWMILDREGLRWAALSQWLRALSLEADLAEETGHGDTDRVRREAAGWRAGMAVALTTLYTEEGHGPRSNAATSMDDRSSSRLSWPSGRTSAGASRGSRAPRPSFPNCAATMPRASPSSSLDPGLRTRPPLGRESSRASPALGPSR